MKKEIAKLKTDIYEIEASLAQQQFLLEIMKDFGEYNSDNSDGVDKMTYLVRTLLESQINLRSKLEDFIPQFQKYLSK